jgi:hypothetical protein
MLPLQGPQLPGTHDEFVSALEAGLAKLLRPASPALVHAEGNFADYRRLAIDLSGSRVLRPDSLATPQSSGQTQPGITAGEFHLVARPLLYEQASFELEFEAREARFVFDRGLGGTPLLVPVEAAGSFRSQIRQADLASLLISTAQEAAAKQGVTIHGIEPAVMQTGERTLDVRVRIQATKRLGIFPASGAFVITGRLEINDSLMAQISALDCAGEGALAKMLAPVIASKLQQFNQQSISLTAFPLGQIRVHDVRVSTPNRELHIQADFR